MQYSKMILSLTVSTVMSSPIYSPGIGARLVPSIWASNSPETPQSPIHLADDADLSSGIAQSSPDSSRNNLKTLEWRDAGSMAPIQMDIIDVSNLVSTVGDQLGQHENLHARGLLADLRNLRTNRKVSATAGGGAGGLAGATSRSKKTAAASTGTAPARVGLQGSASTTLKRAVTSIDAKEAPSTFPGMPSMPGLSDLGGSGGLASMMSGLGGAGGSGGLASLMSGLGSGGGGAGGLSALTGLLTKGPTRTAAEVDSAESVVG